jgi:serine/tyrosine/threonine adenylyltransferase
VVEAATEVLTGFADAYQHHWAEGMAAKLGLAAPDRVNPVYIPRNHRVEEALAQATDGDLGPFHRLVDVVSRPFDERPGLADYTGPAPTGAPYVTYCGT